ncbi:MAG: O-methyltransferase [Peptococcaceae bacterium]|nr:O-methyltransferase [Peptococcaceae bacterium]
MFYPFELEKYLEMLLPPRDELLLEMEREALVETIPVVTPAVGHFLQLLLETAGARSILEIGTATGYSTIYLARGARQTGGRVLTIDMNKGRMDRAVEYIAKAGLKDLVEFRFGNALKILPELSGRFDFIFVDAAKGEYRQYVELILPLMADGGILVLDNVLFRGWVVPGSVYDSKYNNMVETLRAFLQYLAELPGYKLSVLPFGDGLAIVRKNGPFEKTLPKNSSCKEQKE